MPAHPYTGKPRLIHTQAGEGVHVVYVERDAKYRRGAGYKTREYFATIRHVYNAGGLLTRGHCGVVVTRNDFSEIREFDTLDKAATYVEALFALEYGA